MALLDFFNFENITFLMAILISVMNAVLVVLFARKCFQILQISGYKIKGYNIWLKDTKAKYISRLAMLAFLSLCCILVVNFLFDSYHENHLYSYLGLVFYVYFAIVFVVHANKVPQKTPLVQTRRMARLTTLLFLVASLISFALIWLSTVYIPFLRFGIVALTPLLTPILVPLIHFCLIPLEKLIRNNYIARAKKKFAKMEGLTVIGITGSYGKTSVKYILNKMLAYKFNVCITPHSFNTPMGITKVILKYLKKENEILIAEMGAKEVGDIKYLCDIVKPHHAIITGISSQHFETFGSIENIAKTKNELIQSLPENGIAVINCDNQQSTKLFNECGLKNKFAVNDKDSCVKLENIKITSEGSKFDLVYNKKSQPAKTILLGRHNLRNIQIAACLAVNLGVSLEDIAKALEEVEYIPHRLEPSVNGNVTILDDSYSANEEGVKSALEVLKTFEGKKICVTPGLVELGEKEFEVNENYGKLLGETCDYVIIVNKINQQALQKGIESTKIKKENVFYVENLELAKSHIPEITKAQTKFVVLFANDLPDNYT